MDVCFWTPEFDQTSVFLLCCDWHCFFPPLPTSFESLLSTYFVLWRKKKPTKKQKCHIQRILMFRLYTRGADSRAAPCDSGEMHFHDSSCQSGPLISQFHRSPLHHHHLSPSVFPCCTPLSSLFVHPLFQYCDSCTDSGRAIRPISPISWCWVGTTRNGFVAMRVACTDVRCVWAATTVMSVCGLMDGREECVVRGTEWKNKSH